MIAADSISNCKRISDCRLFRRLTNVFFSSGNYLTYCVVDPFSLQESLLFDVLNFGIFPQIISFGMLRFTQMKIRNCKAHSEHSTGRQKNLMRRIAAMSLLSRSANHDNIKVDQDYQYKHKNKDIWIYMMYVVTLH